MLTVERGRSREKIKNYFSRSVGSVCFRFQQQQQRDNNNNNLTTTTAAATFPLLCTNVDLLLCTLFMSFHDHPLALPPLGLSVGIVSMLMPAAVSIAGIAARAEADSSIQLLPLPLPPPFALSCFCHLKTLHSAHGLHNEWNVSSFYSPPSITLSACLPPWPGFSLNFLWALSSFQLRLKCTIKTQFVATLFAGISENNNQKC